MRLFVLDIETDPEAFAYLLKYIGDPYEKDWEQTRFVSGSDNPPSDAKRAKLRAKRKK